METLNLSMADRERIDKLTEQIEKMNSATTEVVLVSCKEAARLLGTSSKTVSVMIRDGRLTKTRIGPSTGIRLSDIREKKLAGMR